VTRAEQEKLLTAAAQEMKHAAGRTIALEYTVIQAMELLGTLQLALRHPANRGPISSYISELAFHLEMFLCECGAATRRLCAAGWNPEEDALSDEGGDDNR